MRIAVATVLLALVLAAGAQAKTLVAYDRVGGIAGEQTSITVSAKGRVVQTSSLFEDRTFTVSQQRLAGLRKALKAARFGSLRSSYAPQFVVSDSQTETVRYAGKAVSVSSGAVPPKRFERVLGKLRGLPQ